MSAIRSMTGFARARRPLGAGEIVVSAKSVNHRGLDIHIHAPSAADPFENVVRSLVKQHVRRGHLDIRISLPDAPDQGSLPAVNEEMLAQYLREFRRISEQHGLTGQPELNSAFRIPGMFGEASSAEPPPETAALVAAATEEALAELNQFREREGAALREEMQEWNRQLLVAAESIEAIRAGATAVFQSRLSQRLEELLKGVQIEPQRLVQEAAILTDRSDIGEEIARLKIHIGQFALLLDEGGEVGKKLDFLLQEMNRETNTILSKTSGIGEIGLKITDLGLAAKSAIEKLREQSLNLE